MNSNPTESPSAPPPPPPANLRRIAEVVVVLIIIGLVIGLVPRWFAHRKLLAAARSEDVLTVDVISPTLAKSSWGTPLPADVQPFMQASIHARASGYLKNWFVDMGAQVTNGQVLAEIDSPEVDQQLAQAKAEVDQAKAALDLSKTTADRWTNLLSSSSVSEQETAEKTADYTLKQANLEAAQANVNRLDDLSKFEHVTAPFDGIVTLRNTDIGQLITAGSGAELFRVSQTNPLRIYVRVPQQYVYAIKPGQKAQVSFLESAGKNYEATVIRTAGAIDPASRTLQVELQVDNPKGELFSGGYAQVRFDDTAAINTLTLSDNALIFRAEGLQVAVVNNDNKVELHSVKLGRDFGNTVEVLTGVSATDRIINNPPDSIAAGMVVKIAPPKTNSLAAK